MKLKLIHKILIGIGVVVVLPIVIILVLASFQPDSFAIKREITIKAPSEKVFGLINNFHNWTFWSPWEKLDPNLKRSYSGADEGVGAVYAWVGNDNVGEGRMEIKESTSPSNVRIDLRFIKPFQSDNFADFRLTPKGDSTQVVWEMGGPNLFMGKVMTLFIDMDSMIGKDFESGLAAMKAKAESEPDSASQEEPPPKQPDQDQTN